MADTKLLSEELQMLNGHKEEGYEYRERRQNEWRENYTLYRDRVKVNRLTQRQSVNIPLMKKTIRTLLKDVDDMPVIVFENLDNDKQAQLYKNEFWKLTSEENRFELLDIMDKRQVFLFGRSFTQWQIQDGKVKVTLVDPRDILVSRFTDPIDINSSRFLIHTHIFEPLSNIKDNEDYNKEAKDKLGEFYGTTEGIIKAEDNNNMLQEKNETMADMGLTDVHDPVTGEVVVELTVHFVWRQEEDDDEEQIYMYITAEDMCVLQKIRLEDLMGETSDHYWRTHYPYDSWADDLERQDFWSDGVADIIRTPNKVLNSWFSQMVENRTLRNFGMQFYDSKMAEDGFSPQTFQPVPWGWYGIPGKPSEVMQRVDIPDLSGSLDEINFVLNMSDSASGSTATKQGVPQQKQVTLGEVKLSLNEASERVRGMSKFYTPAWMNRGNLFLKITEAGQDKLDSVTIKKKGRNTDKIYTKEISPEDWVTKNGYSCKVWSQEEKNTDDINTLQKLNMAKTVMADNPKLNEIYQRRVLEYSKMTPDEIAEVMEYERQKRDGILAQQEAALGLPGGAQPAPQVAEQVPQADNQAIDRLTDLRGQLATAQ